MSAKQEVCGFELVASQELPDCGVTALLYKHKLHGCPFLFLKSDDSHNFFAETFRTAPRDNLGRSHMLEHLVLNGTDKYPVNDLFNELDKRSFSTFLNAMTSNQWTAFPFSTINKQDYFNILDVYLDCCFHPKLSPIDFMSECFHLEFTDNDPTKPLTNSGVIYNEMRGYFNSASTRIMYEIKKHLLPDSTERFESGGLPEDVTKSTINDIKEHHEKYYHPSNAYFYHYGDIPIEEVFGKVDEVISKFPKVDYTLDKRGFQQTRWTEPKRVEIESNFEQMQNDKNKQYKVNVVYLTDPWEDIHIVHDIDFLVDLLTHSDSSPMYKAILKSGLAVRTFLNGFHRDCYNTVVNFGYEGICESDVEKVINIIQEVLEQCYKDGFEQDRIESLIHENELESRKLTSNQGLSLFYQYVYPTCYGIDPLKAVDTNVYIERIRSNLAKNPRYYADMIKTVFFENKHRLTAVVKPVEGYLDAITKKITDTLEEKKKNLTESEIKEITNNFDVLKEYQQRPQPVELLPSIKRCDLTQKAQYDDLTYINDNLAVLVTPMNQMTYVNVTLKVDFNHELLKYLPLLTAVIDSVGAGDMDEEQLDLYMGLHCSRVHVFLDQEVNLEDVDQVEAKIVVKTSCLDRNVEAMMKIIKMVIFEPHLDNVERIKTLITRTLTTMVKSAIYRGDGLVSKYINAGITNSAALNELFRGSPQLILINELIAKNDWKDVSDKLIKIYHEIFLKAKCKALIHTSSAKSAAIPLMGEIVAKLNDHEAVPKSPLIDKAIFSDHENAFIEIETSTNFTAMSCRCTSYLDKRAPIFSIIDSILQNEYLHQLVRVNIGAYGCWASNGTNGTFTFVSFRDPNVVSVLEAFQSCLEFSTSGKIDQEMLDRAVVKTFASLDEPLAPSQKGYLAFEGKSREVIQKRRDIFFNASLEQIAEVAKYLKEQKWVKGAVSSQSIAPPPEGFKVIKITE